MQVSVIEETAPLALTTEDAEQRCSEFWAKHLEDPLNFSAVMEQVVRAEFFMGCKTLPVDEYGRWGPLLLMDRALALTLVPL